MGDKSGIGRVAACLATVGLLGVSAPGRTEGASVSTWTTLGTNSGPIPRAGRSEPANLLLSGSQAVLVDAGDGASVQLAKAGVPLISLHTVILSHLHFDHTGGLFAIIAERYQMLAPRVLTIYGPPGTRGLVDGLIAAMAGALPSGPSLRVPAGQTVRVIEIGDGSRFEVGAIKGAAVANSHYSATPSAAKAVSLSFRFDMPDRSIAYTGYTGPSVAVEGLASGADLLVSEIMDSQRALGELERDDDGIPPAVLAIIKTHFEREHLSPEQVGLLAAHARVKSLVLTHDAVEPKDAPTMRPAIAMAYKGPIRFARDLDSF